MVSVRVHPEARKNAVTGVHAEAVKISLTTPPVDRRANEALIAFLADRLRVTKGRIVLLSGTTNRAKVLRIVGMRADEVRVVLDPVVVC